MYLFNPDNDLALANFSANYTPPATAARMAGELALLPVWYGRGAPVIAEGEENRSFLHGICNILPVSSLLISYADIRLHHPEVIIPWGWNPALRKRLVSCGVQEERLPSPAALQMLRDYSGRLHAVNMLRELQVEEPAYCGESHYFNSPEELLAYLSSFPGDKLLKMPLSGSGKGLIRILGAITDKQTDWCRRVIREQGGVVAEPVLNKVEDFAMEFYLDQGVSRFAGYSMFRSAKSGAYMGNELLSDRRIVEMLSAYIPVDRLHHLRETLLEKLSTRFPFYTGYAGVDMMICQSGESYSIQPCVEINMRMNMGMVACLFHDQFMESEGQGRYVVDYFNKPGNALLFHQKMQRESPLQVVGGKVISGYLSLTPVTEDTRYIAYVVVCRSA
ncbi:MAG: hypothetical protein ITG04_09275 [Proteiniphilum sp.]|jgi:hypothetical protein|nr:hypothetical protein [Proteiniphilum sp.]